MSAEVRNFSINDRLSFDSPVVEQNREMAHAIPLQLRNSGMSVDGVSAQSLWLHLTVHDKKAGFLFVEPQVDGTWSDEDVRLKFELGLEHVPKTLRSTYDDAIDALMVSGGTPNWQKADYAKRDAHKAIADHLVELLEEKGVRFKLEDTKEIAFRYLASIWIESDNAQRPLGRNRRERFEPPV